MREGRSRNEYIRVLGFRSQDSVRRWLTGRDIYSPNWTLMEQRNTRLKEIFTAVNRTLPVQYSGNISEDIDYAYNSIRQNDLLLKMKNNGRAMEDVYYTWMQGYISEKVFIPFIQVCLNLDSLRRNGKDDLTDYESFQRKGDADLVDEGKKTFVEVQCGTHVGKTHIKKHKMLKALDHSQYTSWVFSIRLMYGTWCAVNLNDLSRSGAQFYKNELWENCLCWDIPESNYSPYYTGLLALADASK